MGTSLIISVFNYICDLSVFIQLLINEKSLVNQNKVLSLRHSVSTMLADIPFGRHRKTQSAYIFQKKNSTGMFINMRKPGCSVSYFNFL